MHKYKYSVTLHVRGREGDNSFNEEFPLEISVTAESKWDADSALFHMMKWADMCWGGDKLVWSDDPNAEVK